MKGLYMKDLHLLAKQKMFFLATIFLTVMNAYNLQSLVLVPLFMVFFILAIIFTTVTLDEMNHGFTFLFTLPFSRKKYVLEKYSLAFIGAFFALLLSFGIILIISHLQGWTVDMKSFAIVLAGVLIISAFYISLLLPFYFKFGEGKSRLIILIVMAIIFFFVFLGEALVERLGIDPNRLLLTIADTPIWLLMTVGTLAAIVASSISYFLSVRILNRKEL